MSWSDHSDLKAIRSKINEATQPIDFGEIEQQKGPFASHPPTPEEKRTIRLDRLNALESLPPVEARMRRALSPASSHIATLGFFGSIPGIALAILLASTIFGAEFQWDYVATLALHEPDRKRLLVAKFLSLWLIALAGIALALMLSYAVHLVVSLIALGEALGGFPSARSLGAGMIRASIPALCYSTFAVAGVVLTRSTLGGVLVPGGFILADGLVTRIEGFIDWRGIFPVHHTAWILPRVDPSLQFVPPLWFPRIETVLADRGGVQVYEALAPVEPVVSALVLLGWLALGVVIALLGFRRDIPS